VNSMADPKSRYGKLWSRRELILALFLYCQIPFNHTNSRNNEVKRLATDIGRTPGSVARKLGNFGSFDPLLAAKGIKGLIHAGKGDREVWDEYNGHWDKLVKDTNSLVLEADRFSNETNQVNAFDLESNIVRPQGPTSEYRNILTRRYQSFFRRAVLSSYNFSCCICGLDLPELLIASHILPWSENDEARTDPRNGLCLCAIHDKAFDSGLISVDTEHKIQFSNIIKKSQNKYVGVFLLEFEGKSIQLPHRFSPDPKYLSWHLSNRFLS